MNSVEIVAFCKSYFFNMELPLYRKKSLQSHVKSMVTKHHKAEKKMILIIRNVHLQNVLSTLFDLGSNHIETINYLPPVQHYCSFAWDQMVHEYQWIVIIVTNKTISM